MMLLATNPSHEGIPRDNQPELMAVSDVTLNLRWDDDSSFALKNEKI